MQPIKEYSGPPILNVEAEYTLTHFPELPGETSRAYWKNLKFENKKGNA